MVTKGEGWGRLGKSCRVRKEDVGQSDEEDQYSWLEVEVRNLMRRDAGN